MRHIVTILLAAALLATGCRRAAPAPEITEPEVVVPVFVPEFSVQGVPDSVQARMRGVSYREGCPVAMGDLRYLRLSYVDFEGSPQTGEMVCHKAIAGDLVAIFRELYDSAYPIRSIRLAADFGGSDDASMEADNTSCFNHRSVAGSRVLSQHARGMAVDVNPLENPCVRRGRVQPASGAPFADRAADFPHKITSSDLCCRLFKARGFRWGGDWRSVKDWQHFEKKQ